jgi:predicted glycogen debranching enzyme
MIAFGREITGELTSALRREWLVTNGLGSYAMGTVAGANTRRYHGLLVAALQPPLGRTLLLARLNETALLDGETFRLATGEYADGTVDPQGYRLIESFRLEGSVPVWTYNLADGLLEKRVWMAHGKQTSYVRYSLLRARQPVTLEIVPLAAYRSHHALGRGDPGEPRGESGEAEPRLVHRERSLEIGLAPDGVTLRLLADRGEFATTGACWHWGFRLRAETERGLDDVEDLYAAGTLTATLEPGSSLTLAASLEPEVELDGRRAYAAERARQDALIACSGLGKEPGWIQQLVLAADQFVVTRRVPAAPAGEGRRAAPALEGRSVLAGYPWFSDWGRDTMIALPGLALRTGRPEIAAQVLRTYARFVDQGLLPNNFPDAGGAPAQYNTVDATLWFVEAVECYYDATGDRKLLEELYPVLTEVVERHIAGTRFGIQVDPEDGLLHAGQEGVQLTWMDAKVGDWVVTPRTGKPVEINALWYSALLSLAGFGDRLGRRRGPGRYLELAGRVRESYERFWYPAGGYLYDVIDGPHGPDRTLRPNQLIGPGLTHSPCTDERGRAIVTACAGRLLTSLGLRTLAPDDPEYTGRFSGPMRARDAAYHRGTTWAWLIGPFVRAHYRVFGDAAAARSFLRPFEHHLSDAGLGTISEVFDGDPPYTPGGCIAQAWSVAEVLRAWVEVEE